MGAIIGDGKKYIRDFAVDFTDKETYIGGKAFPKGYFTAVSLNYGSELITRMLIAGGHCFQALGALEFQQFTLEQFDAVSKITMEIHRELFSLEPFCHLDVLAEESILNTLFSSSSRNSLSAYYDLVLRYSGYDRAELQLSDEELHIEQQGIILEASLMDVMRAYSYFCMDIANFTTVLLNFEFMKLRQLEKRDVSNFAKAWDEFFSDKEMRLALLAAQPTLSMDGFSEEAVVATKMVAIAKPQKNGEVMFARRYRFNRIMSFLVMDFFEGLQAGHSPKQCEICSRFFHMTDGRQQRYCNGYAPNDSKHRTCQAVAARMGRKEREKAQDHPVKAVCDTRCNTIDHHLRSGKIDKEFAATAKRIAREKKNRALRDNEYFLGKYEADMTQDAIYTETEQRLGRPPRRECLCPT